MLYCYRVLLLISFIISTVAISAGIVTAQEQEVTEMEEMQVRAESLDNRLSADLAEYGGQVDVITEEDIEKSGARTINEALDKLAPGVHVPTKQGPFSGARVKIQGGSKRDIVWMLDGVRLSNRAFTTFRNNIAPQLIKRLEIIKGPQSIVYGSQGVVAIINIITKDIQAHESGKVEVLAGVGDRDNEIAGQHGDISARFGDHSFMVWGNNHDGQNRPFKDDQIETTASRSAVERNFSVQNIGVKYNYDLGEDENLLLFSQLNHADLDFVQPNNLIDAGNERIQSISYAKYDKQLNQQTDLLLKAYYHGWDSDWTFIGQDNAGNAQAFSVDDQWYFNELGLTAMVDYILPYGSQLIAGADYKNFEGVNRIGDPDAPVNEEQIIAPFALFRPKIPVLPKTKLSAGVRYSIQDESEDNVTYNFSGRRPLDFIEGYVPFTDDLDFRVLVGKGFALPTLLETETNLDPSGIDKIGNPNLEAIESTSYELGVEGWGKLNQWPISYAFNYFNRDNDQGIISVPTDSSGDTVTFVNTDGSRESRGVEAKLALRPDRAWRIQLSGSYFDVEDTVSRSIDGIDQSSNIPEFLFKSTLRYDHPDDGWGAQFTGNYVGTQYDIGSRQDPGIQQLGLDPEFGGYFVADLLAYIYLDDRQRHRFSLGVQNVGNNEFTTQLDDGTRVDGSDFRVDRLGAPLNVTAKYTAKF